MSTPPFELRGQGNFEENKNPGVQFGLSETYYKDNNIPEARQLREGSRVVYGTGANGESLFGVIQTFAGTESGFGETMVGVDPEDPEAMKFGRKTIPLKELMKLNPEGAVVDDAKVDEDAFRGFPKAA